ncbi:inactive hydroxysteroid dehydrogenase-like protein 1 [Penaeus japonicus]|uniref:inactive hydroxysteroid dehydrogenase-like protein 1 n=1 Tax=Penaeus japonicus TaxID=27405 RepID=UPI001C70E0D6|nr:inactive hydroxysteroid dehydrogenase-like protein 1 [Penaeus japonicus]
MAVAVDSAKYLLDEILPFLRRVEEGFALIGICYAGSVTVRFLWKVAKGVRVHFWSKLWRKDLVGNYGKWAVVTGSTDGIGKGYARELAKNGMNIILVSRSSGKLEKVAEEIVTEFGVETDIVQADFSLGRHVYDNIARHLKDKEIGILVNNVGMMVVPKMFDRLTDEDIWAYVNVNVATVPAMTKLVLPGMVERKKGAIINISSEVAHFSLPYLQLYAATKSFVSSFTKAIGAEYSSAGITVQCLEPAGVSTNLNAFDERIHRPGFFTATPDRFAASAVATLGYSKCTTGYWTHGLQLSFLQLFPEWFIVMGFRYMVEFSQKKLK